MQAFKAQLSYSLCWYNFLCVSYYLSYVEACIYNQIVYHSPR